MSAASSAATAGGLVAVLALACGAPAAPPRAPFVAVWLAADSALPERSELTRLAAAGALELFVEAADLAAGDPPPLVPRPARRLARRTPATLVVRGAWTPPTASPRQLGRAWHERLLAAERAWRESGGVPVGVHFELVVADGVPELAAALARLRRELGGRLHLSVALPPPGAGEAKEVAALVAAVDFVTADVYGQPPDAADAPALWDRKATRTALASLAAHGAPYAATAWTLGRAELRRRRGATESLGGALSLGPLLRSPQLVPRPGAVFAGVDRQVLELEARAAVAVAGRTFERGDVVRVTRPTTHDLETLLELLAPAPQAGRVGVVLRQWPPSADLVSLGPAQLAAALEPGSATPLLAVELVPAAARRDRAALRVVLRNAGGEATDLGGGEWNYVQLDFRAGALERVEPGDFAGWEQLWNGRERRTLRALREADTLRLFAPFVGAGETLESGPVELRAAAGELPQVHVSGRFLLPGGRELAIARSPAQWVDREERER